MKLGEWLRYLREQKGWTQYAAAQASKMSQATYAKVESGVVSNPGGDVLRRLASGFGVSVDALLAADDFDLPESSGHDAGRPEHVVPIQVVGVAAGGTPIESEEVREEYPLLHHLWRKGRYVIRLRGDSMHPTIWNGDLLLVEPATHVPNGRIAVVRMKGESTVKRVHKRKAGGWTLRSDNPYYPLIEADADEAEVVARVLRIVEGERP